MQADQLLVAQSGLAVVLVATFAVSWLLLRRVRALHGRIAPLGALAPPATQAVDLDRPAWPTLAGTPHAIAGRGGPRAMLLLFIDGQCPVSRKLVPLARDVCRDEALDLLFCGDGDEVAQRAVLASWRIASDEFVNDPALGRQLGVDRLPFAVLVEPDGTIAARGLVNSREHLESLCAVRESGHASIQSYLRAHPRALDAARGQRAGH